MNEHSCCTKVWEDFGDEGESLHSLELAGHWGDDARRWLGPKARLVATVKAGSHSKA